MSRFWILILAICTAAISWQAETFAQDATKIWQHEIAFDRVDRNGKAQAPGAAFLWLPEGDKPVRGILLAQKTLLEKRILTDPHVRGAAAKQGMAVVYLEPGLGLDFNSEPGGNGERLDKLLAELAKKSGRPEIALAPLLTLGHSTAGIFARNIAYWRPERTIGIIHVKSGNLHQHMPSEKATLAGVPFLAINGEFEEYGPEGGIRPELGRETQWISIRKAMLDRRTADPANLMSLIVHPGGNHTNWDDNLSRYVAMFIRKAAEARLPAEAGDGKAPVKCLAVKAENGWLTDAEIKNPKFEAAAYLDYKGDKSAAFWHLDKEIAQATVRFHNDKFTRPKEGVKSLYNLAYVEKGHERQKLDLHVPDGKADGKFPVIVWIHGGAWRLGDKVGGPAIPYAAKGYAVACINYRFSNHAIFPAQLEDCQTAIRWLRANADKYNLDPDRFVVWGASAGGHLAALVGTVNDPPVQGVIDWFGPCDFTIMKANASDPKSPESELLGATPEKRPDLAAKANPITYVHKGDPPFLMMHGEIDGVSIKHSEMLLAALQKVGTEATLIRLPDTGHGGPAFRIPERMKEIEDFLAKCLKRK